MREGEGRDDGGLHLPLGHQRGEVQAVGEHVPVYELREEDHQLEERVRRLDRDGQVTCMWGGRGGGEIRKLGRSKDNLLLFVLQIMM